MGMKWLILMEISDSEIDEIRNVLGVQKALQIEGYGPLSPAERARDIKSIEVLDRELAGSYGGKIQTWIPWVIGRRPTYACGKRLYEMVESATDFKDPDEFLASSLPDSLEDKMKVMG